MFLLRGSFLKKGLGKVFSSTAVLANECPQQIALKERCFLVDPSDRIVGNASKRECHVVRPDKLIPLHRAFSVFLFNSKGQLLLQRRSTDKITFPDCYTNTCCSHPIVDVPGEEEERNAIGVKRAAQRRLNYELGIAKEALPLEKFVYLTRIHYMDVGNGEWGEHEIDYVLFFQGDVKINPNPNEISEVDYISRKECDVLLEKLQGPVTPWFKLLLEHRLKLWWDNLDNLSSIQDHQRIWQLEPCPCIS